jgi:hypothetical protein
MDRTVDGSHFNSNLWLLPLAYSFIIKIVPFIYIRESYPLYLLEDSPGVVQLHAESPELIKKMIKKQQQLYATTEGFRSGTELQKLLTQAEDIITQSNLLREKQPLIKQNNNNQINHEDVELNNCKTVQDLYSYNRDNMLQVAVPSFQLSGKNSYDMLYGTASSHSSRSKQLAQSKYLFDFQSQLATNFSQFLQLGNLEHWTISPTFFQFTIHIVIFCCNPIAPLHKSRTDLHNDMINKITDELLLNELPTVVLPQPQVLTFSYTNPQNPYVYAPTAAKDQNPEFITQGEYDWFKLNVPRLYKEEFLLKMIPFCSIGDINLAACSSNNDVGVQNAGGEGINAKESIYYDFLNKIEKQFVFHFVGEHEWSALFEKIQSHGVNQRIMLYRNNIINNNSNLKPE